MRNVLFTMLTFILMILGSSYLSAQTNYVVVKLYEPISKAGEIIIAYGNGRSERIEVEKLDSDHHEHNMNKLVDVFNRLDKEGFELESSAGSSHGNPASILHVDTFVFMKKEE